MQTHVINVSLEGLEELTVLLHLEGISKPLRLTALQRQQMAAMFQSNNHADWIGKPLALTVSTSSSTSSSNSSSRSTEKQLDRNDIELTLIAHNPKNSPHSTSLPQSPNRSNQTSARNEEATRQAEATSSAKTAQPPLPNQAYPNTASPNTASPTQASQRRVPHTHFSGAGQEFSVSDPSATSVFGRENSTHLKSPNWLREIGDSAVLKQAQLLLGPNFFVALFIFLMVVVVVQFEKIAELFAFLLP